MRVGDFAQRLDVPYRDVRYILEQGILPEGVEQSPGRGEHRDLKDSQAFWLAIVLKLKAIGIRTPLAGEIADYTKSELRVFKHLTSDRWFQPFRGEMYTEYEWYVEIGDLSVIRFVTSAISNDKGLHECPWSYLGKQGSAEGMQPLVVIRVDLARLAARLME